MSTTDVTADLDLDAYAVYLLAQRWCGGDEGSTASAVTALSWLSDPATGAGVRVELVDLETSGGTHRYQLPVVHRAEPVENLGHALVAAVSGAGDGATVYVYDALHDPEARAVLARGFVAGADQVDDLVYDVHGEPVDADAETFLLSVEQSNTSLVIGQDAVLKVFRRVLPGRNPDIEVHEAISADGGDSVAAILGSIRTRGVVGGTEDDEYDLAMLQRYLRTATGGWDSARASLRDLVNDPDLAPEEAGGDFAADAHRLGLTTAHVHALMAERLPTASWSGEDLTALADRFDERLEAAVAAAPVLQPHVEGVRARYADVRELDAGVPVQRVHGDLHLGQALRTTAGWKIIDFEGEPSQPVADRVRLDCPVRDVAGMLRSLDYAARSVLLQVGIESEAVQARASAWLERNRTAFLDGYGFGADTVAQRLLAAYELDKAVYEVVYEVRFRPTWVDIPLRAVATSTR